MGKFCPNCGKEVKENVKYCANCGSFVNDSNSQMAQNTTTTVNVNQNQSNGMATAGFVVSLVSALLCCGLFNWLGFIFSIIGLVDSKNKNGNGKGLAIAGIVISCIGVVILIFLAVTGILTEVSSEIVNSTI